MSVSLRWLGHSCFKLTCKGYSLVVDPYAPGSVPGLRPLNVAANAVYCSHGHDDHNCEYAVTLEPFAGPCPFSVETLDSWHDDCRGKKRGPNSIRVFTADGIRAAHLGDLGCELTAEQEQRLFGLDALMVPVGGFFTIDAAAADRLCRRLAPRTVIPMHYSGYGFGYAQIAPLSDFLKLRSDVVTGDSDTLELGISAGFSTFVPRLG